MTYREFRCAKCGRLMAKLDLAPGSRVQIKCSSCNTFNTELVLPATPGIAGDTADEGDD